MIDPDHSIFRTYREDNNTNRMAHIPYYGEDEKKTDKRKSETDAK